MRVILFHNHFDVEHLDEVKAEMNTLGAPTIKAVWMDCWDSWVALEGCHRLRAAHALGITPEIEAVEYSTETMLSDLGIDAEDDYSIEQVCDGAHRCETLTFEVE